MIKKFIITQPDKEAFLIEARFDEDEQKELIKKEDYIFDDPEKETAYIYLGSEKEFNINKLLKAFNLIITNKNRNYQINLDSFVVAKIKEEDVINSFIFSWYEVHGKTFNLKTKREKYCDTYLLTKRISKSFDDIILIATQMNEIRMLQDMAPNILTTNEFAKYIKGMCDGNDKLSLTILETQDLKRLNMNLILGVNAGSKEATKVAIIEYKGSHVSKEKITFVGKGIMFDSGGYNLKTPGKYMLDMKYDMSGAAISVVLVDTIAKLGIRKNVSCIVPLTDNMIDSEAQVPETILTSMSGKTVEVANTDAEGRLVLADAITYAALKLNSTLIIDLATLTGTVLYALGRYTGAWSTDDKNWLLLENSAKKSNELIWRMPLDDIYLESLTKETYADTWSCSFTDKPDSNIAATWLNQFAMGKDYIHLDIAGSADIDSRGKAPMFKTLIEFVKGY